MSSEAGSSPTADSEDARGRLAASARVGMFAPFDLLERGPEAARAFLEQAGDAGIDHVCCGDHVSFAGAGFDGLVQATALAMLHPTLPIYSGVYLLPLRHPVLVARQLADIDRIAPGRLIFGVGVGGEDRREVSICGVDPATWGLRMDECLTDRDDRVGHGAGTVGAYERRRSLSCAEPQVAAASRRGAGASRTSRTFIPPTSASAGRSQRRALVLGPSGRRSIKQSRDVLVGVNGLA